MCRSLHVHHTELTDQPARSVSPPPRTAASSLTVASSPAKRVSLLRLAVLTCVLTRLDSKIEIVDFPRLYDHRCGNQFPASGGPFVEDRVKIIAINRSASVVVCHEP